MIEALAAVTSYCTAVISMRGAPLIDAMGAQAIQRLAEEQRQRGGDVYFSGVQPAVQNIFVRSGLLDMLGEQQIFWSADQAIVAVYKAHIRTGCPWCTAQPSGTAPPQGAPSGGAVPGAVTS